MPDLPQVSLGVPTLVGAQGCFVDLSSLPTDQNTWLLIEDLSGLASTVAIQTWYRDPVNNGVFFPADNQYVLFQGPVPIRIASFNGPQFYYQGRLYVIFVGITKPRVIRLTTFANL